MLRTLATRRAFSSSVPRNAFAKMQLLGNIGNITVKETKDKVPYVSYSLAVNRYDPTQQGDGKNQAADWYNVLAFDEKLVQFLQNYMGPGAQVYVEADVKQRSFSDEADGAKQVYTVLRQTRLDVIRFPKRKDAEGSAEAEA